MYDEAIAAVLNAMQNNYGNPSSTHEIGKRAKKQLEECRETVAGSLGVSPEEVYFTSGGSESNNLAIAGACRAARPEGRDSIITSTLEHPSVTKSVRGLKREGWSVSYIDAVGGEFSMDDYMSSLHANTALVTVMSVQNELGYRFPIAEIAEIAKNICPDILVHTDAVQAFCKIPIAPYELGVDLVSMSGHKIGGPKGIGALFVKRGTYMFTTAFGGGQERGLRSGTEALPLIAGFAKAVEISSANLEEKGRKVRRLNDELASCIRRLCPDVIFNSRPDGSPYLLNCSIPHLNNTKALEFFSDNGVYISKASACTSNHETVPKGTWREKHPLVLELAGVPLKRAKNTLRVSFSQQSTIEDINHFAKMLSDYLALNE